MLPFALLLAGFVSHLRSEVGRKTLQATDISSVIEAIPGALEDSLSRAESKTQQIEETTGYTGLRRLVDWTLLFAPNMSPETAPYRTYYDYLYELRGIFAFGGADLTSASGWFYPTQYYARMYGFNVHVGVDASGRQSSYTVPFNVVADSWSRYGLPSTVIQITILLAFFAFAEWANRRLFSRFPDVMVFGLLNLVYFAVFYSNVYGLTSTIRRFLVYYTAGVIFAFALRWIRIKFLANIFPSLSERPSYVPGQYVPPAVQHPQLYRRF